LRSLSGLLPSQLGGPRPSGHPPPFSVMRVAPLPPAAFLEFVLQGVHPQPRIHALVLRLGVLAQLCPHGPLLAPHAAHLMDELRVKRFWHLHGDPLLFPAPHRGGPVAQRPPHESELVGVGPEPHILHLLGAHHVQQESPQGAQRKYRRRQTGFHLRLERAEGQVWEGHLTSRAALRAFIHTSLRSNSSLLLPHTS